MRLFPNTMVITNIHQGKGNRSRNVYAALKDTRDNSLIISATLDYINSEIRDGRIVSPEEYDAYCKQMLAS